MTSITGHECDERPTSVQCWAYQGKLCHHVHGKATSKHHWKLSHHIWYLFAQQALGSVDEYPEVGDLWRVAHTCAMLDVPWRTMIPLKSLKTFPPYFISIRSAGFGHCGWKSRGWWLFSSQAVEGFTQSTQNWWSLQQGGCLFWGVFPPLWVNQSLQDSKIHYLMYCLLWVLCHLCNLGKQLGFYVWLWWAAIGLLDGLILVLACLVGNIWEPEGALYQRCYWQTPRGEDMISNGCMLDWRFKWKPLYCVMSQLEWITGS